VIMADTRHRPANHPPVHDIAAELRVKPLA
jgi:hypothetical protein